MDEYIAKTALYGEVAKLEELARNRYLETPIISPAYTRYTAQMQDMTAFKHLIADFPAADVEPVERGRWIHKILLGEHAWFCSECKTIGSPAWKRCPVCEAKMIEEAQNER